MITLIKNGMIITDRNEFKGDILIEGQRMSAIGKHIEADADRIIDAEGKMRDAARKAFDQHTHFSALCNVGDKDTAGYETTDSAIVGGTTTMIEPSRLSDPDTGLLGFYRLPYQCQGKGRKLRGLCPACHGNISDR